MKKYAVLNNFTLKLIAVITMTIDHIGQFLMLFSSSNQDTMYQVGNILKYIGRLSLPLFAFLLVEGALHTRSLIKYSLRVGIMALIIAITLIIIQYAIPGTSVSNLKMYNIFLLLFLSIITIWCFNLKKYFKLFAILPIGYVIGTYVILITNTPYVNGLIPDYTIYGFGLIILTYLILKFYNTKIHKTCIEAKIDEEAYKDTSEYRFQYNFLAIVPLIILTTILTILNNINIDYTPTFELGVQTYALISALFILLYSGKLGPSNKYIKYGFYLYYPVHIALLYLIFILIF